MFDFIYYLNVIRILIWFWLILLIFNLVSTLLASLLYHITLTISFGLAPFASQFTITAISNLFFASFFAVIYKFISSIID